MSKRHDANGGGVARFLLTILMLAAIVPCGVMVSGVKTVQAAETAPAGSDMTIPSLAGGYSFSLLVCSDGTLWATGLNQYSQLGLGDTTDRLTPTQVGSATNWMAVTAQYWHSLGVRSDGTLWAWGNNDYYQLGLGDNITRTAPTQVGSDNDWVAVAGRWDHSLALRSDGTLWAWGYNYNGLLGLGAGIDEAWSPTQVSLTTELSLSVTTLAATGISATAATLNGNLTGRGSASSVQVSFEWGLTTSYGNITTPQSMSGTGAFSRAISGLSPGSTYHFRAKAVGNSTAYGSDMTFTTTMVPLTPPTVTTNDASNIGLDFAQLNGNLTSLGTASGVSVSFQWGTTPGVYVDETMPEVKNSTGAFQSNLSGLASGTTYYYRAKAVGDGTSYGLEESLTTTAPPVVSTSSASDITATSATLNGSLTSLGTASSVSVSFQWGTTSGVYVYETTPEVKNSAGAFQFNLSGLASGTTYYYRAKAVGDGTSYGLERSLTTVIPPTAITSDASNITTNSARLNGNVASLGSAGSITVSFAWGTSLGSYSYETTVQAMMSTGSFHFDLGGLTPGTTYYYKAKVDGDGEAVYGVEKSFTTGRSPVVEDINPVSGKRGRVLTVTIFGANLDGATAVGFGSGITVEDFTVRSGTRITAEITIGADAEIGTRDVSVTTGWGTATKADAFNVTGGGGGICSGGAAAMPGAPSEMMTTLAALVILFGAAYLLHRKGGKSRSNSTCA